MRFRTGRERDSSNQYGLWRQHCGSKDDDIVDRFALQDTYKAQQESNLQRLLYDMYRFKR